MVEQCLACPKSSALFSEHNPTHICSSFYLPPNKSIKTEIPYSITLQCWFGSEEPNEYVTKSTMMLNT